MEDTAKEILNDLKEKYGKVKKFLDEDSKNDPQSEPYLSKYKAKAVLTNMQEIIVNDKLAETIADKVILNARLGAILLNIGVIEMDTEEHSASEKTLTEAEKLLESYNLKQEVIIVLLNVYNNLGILWSNRDVPDKAKLYLHKAKELYENFKCTLQMPISIDSLFGIADGSDPDDWIVLEKAHTLTLYYLAQVYGTLKEHLKSAMFCHITLQRQLNYNDYEPIEWALNSATLSQFFAEKNGFLQSRHHLAASSTILEQYQNELQNVENQNEENFQAKLETFNHRSADVARCWAKYCLLLLSSSKDRLMNDEGEKLPPAITDLSDLSIEDQEGVVDVKKFTFPDFDISKFEKQVTDKYLLTYEDARNVFLCCQNWLDKAKQYYTLESLASDYIEITQDQSQAYSSLAFFEEDDERQAKMHKRRINLIEALVKEINPTYYMQYCRQLWYELGEIYSDILNIKLDKLNKIKERSSHAITKINTLADNSVQNYDNFLISLFDPKTGKMPAKLDEDMMRPVISAYVFIGRNSMKKISSDKKMLLINMNKGYEAYKAAVDICSNDERAALLMHEEYSLCQAMVNILSIKIKKLETEIVYRS